MNSRTGAGHDIRATENWKLSAETRPLFELHRFSSTQQEQNDYVQQARTHARHGGRTYRFDLVVGFAAHENQALG